MTTSSKNKKNSNLTGDPPDFDFGIKKGLTVDLPGEGLLPDLSESDDAMSDDSHSTIRSNVSVISSASRKRKTELDNNSSDEQQLLQRKNPRKKGKKPNTKMKKKMKSTRKHINQLTSHP